MSILYCAHREYTDILYSSNAPYLFNLCQDHIF